MSMKMTHWLDTLCAQDFIDSKDAKAFVLSLRNRYGYFISMVEQHIGDANSTEEYPLANCSWMVSQIDSHGDYNKWAKNIGGETFDSGSPGHTLLFESWAEAKIALDCIDADDPEVAKTFRIFPVVSLNGQKPGEDPKLKEQERIVARYATFDGEEYAAIPSQTKAALAAYVLHGNRGGEFLDAVFSNNLQKAFAHADLGNRAALNAIVHWVYMHAPGECTGSAEKLSAWSSLGGAFGWHEAQKKAPDGT